MTPDKKNIIMFVCETQLDNIDDIKKKKQEDYTYTDYLTMACDEFGYNAIFINKSGVTYNINDDIINIDDTIFDVHIKLTKENVEDTIIFQGQSNANLTTNYITLFKTLEFWGFLIYNPIDTIINASNKILSANLLSLHNIPQPNYVYINKNILENSSNDLNTLLCKLYDNNKNIEDFDTTRQYVVKTLGGSLGIGVFICSQDEMLSILQTIFTVDENMELMIQEYCVNTGDIRVHCFSIDGKNYEVLAAMKRNKIKGDFRSNVSLGATTENYKLSDKELKIVLNTAKITQCNWVGIDLMNTDDDRVLVIEYNSSPGVEGISQQINKNIFSIIFDKINKNAHKKNNVNESKILESVHLDGIKTEPNENENIKNIVLISKSTDVNQNDGAAFVKEVEKCGNLNAYCFEAASVNIEKTNGVYTIKDNETSVELSEENKKDTIVINRSAVVNHENAIAVCNMLEKDGFLIFNPISTCILANDKYEMSKIFEKENIPHPRFTLMENKDIKNIDDKLAEIYDEPKDDSKYVCKLLDGHGGKGVFLCTGETILGTLQTIFHLDNNRKILIEEFCECDGGDLRVHVLTLNDRQVILAAMKRNKLDKDFRSNVSLGADTENIELTKEQEKIAFDVAKASKMPWCAVDIMPLKKKSLDGYKNIVLEFNDSPGFGGISSTLGVNIINILLKNITENDLV